MVTSTTSSTDTVLTPEELLARAKENAAKNINTAGLSEVQKLLAEHGDLEDIVEISPVQKILQQRAQQKTEQTPYTEQDWFVKLKVQQLRTQLAIYTNLPGLDPSGATIDSISKEITDLVRTQQAKAQEVADKAAEKQAELDAKKAEQNSGIFSADELLKRAGGGATPEPLSPEVQKLLDNAKDSVDTSA